jgi:HEAT repeat protein
VEPLLAILVDSKLRDPNGPGAGWGPVHAAMLLGQLRAPQTVEPLLDVLATAAPPSDLYLEVSQALVPFGAVLINPILDRVPTAIGSYRQELWVLLAGAGVRDPRIFDQLLTALAEQPEEGAMRLSEYGDRAAIPHLTQVLDSYRPRLLDDSSDDRIVFELCEAIESLGGTLTQAQRRKHEHARITRTVENSLKNAREQPHHPESLCFCGSGRQYKYCCLQ